MKIGIFDSGIGGAAVAKSLGAAFPDADILVVDDKEHLPYGSRTADDITSLTDKAISPLLSAVCDIIVIACNSATAAAIETLRERYPAQLFIGLEPMVKPAALLTSTGTVAICATPATLQSARYQKLKDSFGHTIKILEPGCSQWAQMIEDNTLNESMINETIENVCVEGADVIVLACTHYHWIQETIERIAEGRASVINPSDAIAKRVTELLQLR